MDTPTAPLSISRVRLDHLVQDPANARQHGERNLDAIKGSLARFGQAEPLVVHKASRRVIGGNGRLTAMRALGWTECDVVLVDCDEVTATALGIALNRTAELAEWDLPALGRLLDSLKTEDALDGIGFDESEIDALLAELAAQVGPDAEALQDIVPEPPDAATTRAGDLWILGDHRLLCGDSAAWDDVERLLGGARIHLLNTDPPYNVKVEPRSNNAIAAGLSSFAPKKQTHHQKLDLARHPGKAKPTGKMRAKDRPLANDFVPADEFDRLLRAWFGNASRALLPGHACYVWGGYGNLGNYPPALAESGLYFSQGIVWVKEHPVLTRKDFLGNFELAFYGWREGAAHRWLGPTNAVDVWSVKKLNHTAMSHLTEKPVELAARAMRYSSKQGENVLDLFGGSGSTMAAAEQLGRRALLMEIDPLYCDVIVARWQKLTGRAAVLDGGGQTFAELAAERGTAEPAGPPAEAGLDGVDGRPD
ncbi:MAG TPA: DNA methyltransferase [Planctomycetota bacterium]|nr:DNA methyltransferase [Planctomycetota bacterium]